MLSNRHPFRILVATILITVTAGCISDAEASDNALEERLSTLEVAHQDLSDRAAIMDVATCFGRGLDVLSHAAAAPEAQRRDNGLSILRECLTEDAEFNSYLLSEETPPVFAATGVETWAEFVLATTQMQNYTTTRHLVSNIAIEFTSEDSALVTSYAIIPHFIVGPPADPEAPPPIEPTMNLVPAKFIDEVERQDDGTWKSVRKSAIGEEAWLGTGFYPIGQLDRP